jgi:hypothetical protein
MREDRAAVEMSGGQLLVNGQVIDRRGYYAYHRNRIAATLAKLHDLNARKIVEVGGHPWVITAHLIDDPQFEVGATISAEELIKWPDDIGVSAQEYRITTPKGTEACFVNYSANVERTLFNLHETPDTVLACEIVEHLIRSPHVMFLNINRWLPVLGKVLVTTPNGAQFNNPLRRKSPTPAYRCNIYERHTYLYTLDGLTDLIALCGFKIVEAGYWDVYERHGLSRIYDLLSHLPWQYCREKFSKTLYVVGEKVTDVTALEGPPRVYDPCGEWEFIGRRDQGRTDDEPAPLV